MPLALIVGPPNSGRAGEIRARLEAALDRDPVLVVPTLDDADRFERELCTPSPTRAAWATPPSSERPYGPSAPSPRSRRRATGAELRPQLSDTQRLALVRAAVRQTQLEALSGSAARRGFAPALERLISELQSSLITPGELASAAAELEDGAYESELARLYEAYVGGRDAAGRDDAHSAVRKVAISLRERPRRLGLAPGAPVRVRRPDRGAARAGGGADRGLPGHGRRQLRGPRGAGAARRAAGAASRRARRRGGEQARLRGALHAERRPCATSTGTCSRPAPTASSPTTGSGCSNAAASAARPRPSAARSPGCSPPEFPRTASRSSCGTPIATGPCSGASSRDSGSRSRSRRPCRWLERPPAAASPRWRARACPRRPARSCSPSCGPAPASRRESPTGPSAACCAARRAPRTS